MSGALRIGLFALGLLVVFGVAAGVGSLAGPADTESDSKHGAEHATAPQSERTEGTMNVHGKHQGQEGARPAGLAIAEAGYTLRMASTELGKSEARELRFAIEGPAGEPVTEFDELHERRMHLIVVRRDGTEFRHLHPEMREDGTWVMPIQLDQPGVYRAFADFSVGGDQHTLAADLFVSGGEFAARPFPAPDPLASTGGYQVRLEADGPVAGKTSTLGFAVAKDGHGVHDLAPYLGAKGHLVALREGDLAYLHVHPEEPGGSHGHGSEGTGEGHEGDGNEIAFAATFPTAGRYRLYLQFRHGGAVRTAEFTVEVPR